ncbi:MAG: peptidase M10 [Sphingobacteriales bacterium]|nr:peptidase M10 [Sphingobacteriales bacterium]
MGTAETEKQQLVIRSRIITYGNAATEELTGLIREEIETMWNEPDTWVPIGDYLYRVVFRISADCQPLLTDIDIYQNLDPVNNYFRIEEFAHGNISFVDGLGCNSGYFKLENLYEGSTTAAHEYGHTLGLDHPELLDIRGKGVPGIMYPRGTLVDPPYQYEPDKPAGTKGGTLHPRYRRVREEDILRLKLPKLEFENGIALLGEFSNIWHPNHAEIANMDYLA